MILTKYDRTFRRSIPTLHQTEIVEEDKEPNAPRKSLAILARYPQLLYATVRCLISFLVSFVPFLLCSYSVPIDVELAQRTFRYILSQSVLMPTSNLFISCCRGTATLFQMLDHIATLNQEASKLLKSHDCEEPLFYLSIRIDAERLPLARRAALNLALSL